VVAVAFALLVSGLSLWWLVLSSSPPIRSTGTDHAVTRDVQPGGELLVARSFCVDKPPVCTVSRSIVNAKVQSLAAVDGPTELGCFQDKVYSVEIPGFTEGGPHVYRETMRCIINPAVTKVVVMPDIPFNVVLRLSTKR
jgi:hypothetical protein